MFRDNSFAFGGACLIPEVARLSGSRRHPLVAVSASSVGSLANHSLCNCEAVLRQYGGEDGRLLAQSITMRRVCRPDNQQTQPLLPRLRRPSKWELRSASLRMILRCESVAFPRAIVRQSGDVDFRRSLLRASAAIWLNAKASELVAAKRYTRAESSSTEFIS